MRPDSSQTPDAAGGAQALLKAAKSKIIRCFYYLAPRHFTVSLFAFVTTVITSRMISYYDPNAHWHIDTVHLHHFVFGIFAISIAGYGALKFTGPRAPFFIALLYGFGIGLTADEFDMWLNLSDDLKFRWSDNGLVVVGVLILVGFAWKSIRKARLAAAEPETVLESEDDAEAATE
jgi:hypothetical protein